MECGNKALRQFYPADCFHHRERFGINTIIDETRQHEPLPRHGCWIPTVGREIGCRERLAKWETLAESCNRQPESIEKSGIAAVAFKKAQVKMTTHPILMRWCSP